MKTRILNITIHSDKLAPLPWTQEMDLFITQQFSIFQGSLCIRLNLFTPLSSLDSLCDNPRTSSLTGVKRQVSLIRGDEQKERELSLVMQF